jgi:hypothetical protein
MGEESKNCFSLLCGNAMFMLEHAPDVRALPFSLTGDGGNAFLLSYDRFFPVPGRHCAVAGFLDC